MPPPAKAPNKLYDQLLEFFASAIFQMPVLNFIDQNCMIFCSENDDNPEYREVHLQYKALVSALIGAFCEDTKIKYDDFITALSDFSDRAKGFEGTALKAVYEQVLAAENYGLFVNLMLRHNVELQQQCLLLILREIGNLPPAVIAAATGASVETLQALVASAQQGASGGTGAVSHVAGQGSSPTPSDQELAILIAVLKESSLEQQPATGTATASTAHKQPSAASTPSGGKGALGPLPPMAKSSGIATGDTAKEVAEFVDKMAGKKADYDRKVEQESSPSLSPSPVHEALAEVGEEPVTTVDSQKTSNPEPDIEPPLYHEISPSMFLPSTEGNELSTGSEAMLSEEKPGSSGGGSLSNLPPLPGAGSSHGMMAVSGKRVTAEDQTSLAAISAMLQPLANDSGSSQYNENTAAMLKNPATQRALEALKNMNADDLVARSEYLKAQRDRLISLKQQQRKNVLDEEAKKQVTSRPKSAKISKQFVDDDKPHAGALSPEDEERLRVRRSIGEAIKRELMASKPDDGKK